MNSNQHAVLLKNEGGNSNNWINIRLVGKHNNRDGIGSKVIVNAGGVRQISEVKSGSSYASGSDLRLMFGLGDVSVIDSVKVKWQNGTEQIIENVGFNQFLMITEAE